jgi:Zn-dependent peptidase ImmA (M78 family)
MAAERIPVNPAVLRWAVLEDGRPLDELADLLDVALTDLDAWCEGSASPTRGQLTKTATVLRRPRAVFFLPSPPEQASTPPSFRHPPGSSESASPAALRVFRRAGRVQQAVAWARAGDPVVDLPRARLDEDPTLAARRVREWVGVADDEQAKWRDDYQALGRWREALDDRDVLVFQLDIGRDEVRGFSRWDPSAPMVALNVNRVSPAARVFTLGHELGHLALRQDAACVDAPTGTRPVDRVALERWCEAFAGAFLVPREPLDRFMSIRRPPRGVVTLDDVKAVAARFRVSHRAAALRLVDTGRAEWDLYFEVLRVFRPKEPKEVEPGSDVRRPSRSTSRIREYGPRTLRAVLGTMPETDAMSVLRVDSRDVRQLAEKVPGVRAS